MPKLKQVLDLRRSCLSYYAAFLHGTFKTVSLQLRKEKVRLKFDKLKAWTKELLEHLPWTIQTELFETLELIILAEKGYLDDSYYTLLSLFLNSETRCLSLKNPKLFQDSSLALESFLGGLGQCSKVREFTITKKVMELVDFDVVPILNLIGYFSGLEKLVLQELEGVEDLNRDALDELLIQLSMNSPTLKRSFKIDTMVKDRLQELNIIRDNGSEEDLSRRNDQNQGEFFALIEEIRHDLEILGSNIEGSKKIQNKIISDPLNRAKLQADLSDVKQAIKKKASMIKTKLNQVAQISAKDESSTAGRIQKTVLTTTVQNFVESMRNYNGIQADHQDKVIGQIQRMKDIGAVDEDRDTETGTELMQAQMAKQQLNDLEARFSHFTKLEDSIEEMRDMFLDMNMLVESQGEVIDRIESHVQNAEVDVEHAAEQTKIARKYQSLARRKKIYLITCVVLTLHLDLSGDPLSEYAYAAIAQMKSLHNLSLNRCNLKLKSLLQIMESLEALTSLECDHKIQDLILSPDNDATFTHSKLESIALNGVEGLTLVAEGFPYLREISVDYPNFGEHFEELDEGFKALTQCGLSPIIKLSFESFNMLYFVQRCQIDFLSSLKRFIYASPLLERLEIFTRDHTKKTTLERLQAELRRHNVDLNFLFHTQPKPRC
ncbi:hypothetical protein TCAL_05086 [Tigriopus californicus]|uniref:t-SNARE coiled-coil homology domain-containing protein n=1 Tax=Tigriopus californicus TaxID=6832 RepID=A0A553NVI0_TIGCA|nr:hypothetical protein TCAL_05086 [Tigriopus californicus]